MLGKGCVSLNVELDTLRMILLVFDGLPIGVLSIFKFLVLLDGWESKNWVGDAVVLYI